MMNYAILLFFGCFIGNLLAIKIYTFNVGITKTDLIYNRFIKLIFNEKCSFLIFLLVTMFNSTTALQRDVVDVKITMRYTAEEMVHGVVKYSISQGSYKTDHPIHTCGNGHELRVIVPATGPLKVSLVRAQSADMLRKSTFTNLKIQIHLKSGKIETLYVNSGSTLPHEALTTFTKSDLDNRACQPYSPEFRIEADCSFPSDPEFLMYRSERRQASAQLQDNE